MNRPDHVTDPAAFPRLIATAVVLLLLWPGIKWTEFDLGVLLDPANRKTIAQFAGTFFPLNLSPDFLSLIFKATLETLALATAGMALAVAIAFPLSLVVSRSLSVSRIGGARANPGGRMIRAGVRILLMLLRGIPEIVWALLFVRAVGLGPAAGVLAIAITYSGMLGKIYSEIFESVDGAPVRVLLESGGGRVVSFFYGLFPGALPELVSYTVYRWECAVRASVVMGFVGAGGLGQQMELSMRMLNGGEASTILIVFLLLVMLADGISAVLRRSFT